MDTNGDIKMLLLKDLCSRLPYGVKCNRYGNVYQLVDIDIKRELVYLLREETYVPYSISRGDIIKPYLRPLSSMTEEEFGELEKYSELIYDQLNLASFQDGAYKCLDFYLTEVPSDVVIRVFDWLNKNHFDYRGLIERGLAIEITKENNPCKE